MADVATNETKVLVVDDDRAIRESLDRVLSLEGYAVTTAADGAAALELARCSDVDLIVLDLMMPSIDGLTACRVLRSESDPDTDPDADRADRDDGPRRRAGRRGRRLPDQAVRPGRAVGTRPGAVAPQPPRARHRTPRC